MVQRLREGWLEEELARIGRVRHPPVPVVAWLALDGENHEGLLYGWAANPNGADDGWRGFGRAVRGDARRVGGGAWCAPCGSMRAGSRLSFWGGSLPSTSRSESPISTEPPAGQPERGYIRA